MGSVDTPASRPASLFRTVWKGVLDFDNPQTQPLECSFSIQGWQTVNALQWPNRLSLRFFPVTVPVMSAITTAVLPISHPIHIQSSQESESALSNKLGPGRVGIILFPESCDTRIMIVFGNMCMAFLPFDQEHFYNNIREKGFSNIIQPSLQSVKHPAPLPPKPLSASHETWFEIPPKPRLTVSADEHGIVLLWNMIPQSTTYAKLRSFEIFGYHEQNHLPINTLLWKKIETVNAVLPVTRLPVTCTLTQFTEGNTCHFSVRAVDVHNRCGDYSDPISIVYKKTRPVANSPSIQRNANEQSQQQAPYQQQIQGPSHQTSIITSQEWVNQQQRMPVENDPSIQRNANEQPQQQAPPVPYQQQIQQPFHQTSIATSQDWMNLQQHMYFLNNSGIQLSANEQLPEQQIHQQVNSPQHAQAPAYQNILRAANSNISVEEAVVRQQQHLVKHPAPLPPKPLAASHETWFDIPPKTRLIVSAKEHGIVLVWSMMPNYPTYSKLSSFEIFGYHEQNHLPINSLLWKKIGTVRALALPMSCTLTQFTEGNTYHFSVRAVDVHNRCGDYSDPISIVYKQTRGVQQTSPYTRSNSVSSCAGPSSLSRTHPASPIVRSSQELELKVLSETKNMLENLWDKLLSYEAIKQTLSDRSTDNKENEEQLCKICFDQRLNMVFDPCGHMVSCQECSWSLTDCPICRGRINKKIKVYAS